MKAMGSFSSPKKKFTVKQEHINPTDTTTELRWYVFDGDIRIEPPYDTEEEAVEECRKKNLEITI
jgi:hypothetical protein